MRADKNSLRGRPGPRRMLCGFPVPLCVLVNTSVEPPCVKNALENERAIDGDVDGVAIVLVGVPPPELDICELS